MPRTVDMSDNGDSGLSIDEDLRTLTTNTSAMMSSPVRPILVGYAFGPKKMSTMGIIMAEASQVLPTVIYAAVLEGSERVGNVSGSDKDTKCAASLSGKVRDGVKVRDKDQDCEGDEPSLPSLVTCSSRSDHTPPLTKDVLEERVKPSTDKLAETSSVSSSRTGGTTSFLRLRPRRTSFSSIASQSSSIISALAPSYIAFNQISGIGSDRLQPQPIRVSFVPLDLDSPLEEQHGGNFDVILHKLTEDILCISKSNPFRIITSFMSTTRTADTTHSATNSDQHQQQPFHNIHKHAIARVGRLTRYKQTHPSCCLVDHPDNIKAVMSRSDIAHILSNCLVNVTTSSGVPVFTPRYLVMDSSEMSHRSNDYLATLIEKAPFTYPIIAKPLTAAGTVKSHRMMVVLGRKGLPRMPTPCLVQEYANHDKTLYKVYVLGDTVWVFSRNSLPNLPIGECTNERHSYVEFDSQRPYPKLSDFGVHLREPSTATAYVKSNNTQGKVYSPTIAEKRMYDIHNEKLLSYDPNKRQKRNDNRKARIHSPTLSSCQTSVPLVTSDEIRPVASVLGKAFGLELFGFDILVTNGRQGKGGRNEMLVVDVNYFPSYKEVSNFPSLLAQYLTERAIQGRMQSLHSR